MVPHLQRARNPLLARAPVTVPQTLRHIANPGGGHLADASGADELIKQRVGDRADELEVAPSLPDHLVASGERDQGLESEAERDSRVVRDETADGFRHRHDFYCPIDSREERWFRSSSGIESPPNFSRKASSSGSPTTASPITPAAGTTQTSLRS